MPVHPAWIPLAGALLAAQNPPPSPDPRSPDQTSAEQTLVMLTEIDDRMTVPVSIAGAGPFRFVIDTGAERTVISRQLATTLGLSRGADVNIVAMSGISRTGTVIIPSLTMSNVPHIGRIIAPALDSGDLGGLGLLGIDTLQRHKVTIDFDAQRMTVSPSTRRDRREKRVEGEVVVRARSVFGQLIVTDADVDGRAVRVVLDTGSPVSIGNGALRRLVRRDAGRFEPLELTSATGGVVQTDYSRTNKLRIGGVEFTGMPIAFSDAAPFERFGLDRKPAMLLGMNALKFFRQVIIDFPNREVRFQLPRRDRMANKCRIQTDEPCAA